IACAPWPQTYGSVRVRSQHASGPLEGVHPENAYTMIFPGPTALGRRAACRGKAGAVWIRPMRLEQYTLDSKLFLITLGLAGCPDKQADVSKEPAAASSAAQPAGASDKSGAPAAADKKKDDQNGW